MSVSVTVPVSSPLPPFSCINFQTAKYLFIPAAIYTLLKKDTQTSLKNWHDRSISFLTDVETSLIKRMPNLTIQTKMDNIACYLEKKFAPLSPFKTWLFNNGHGNWFSQLTTFLAKLPLKVAFNIIDLLYDIIKSACYTTVHPLRALNHLTKSLITLVYELTKPATWSKIGAGIAGTSLGQGVTSGNPLSIIGLGIGAALILGGLSLGTIQAGIHAEHGHILKTCKEELLSQTKQIPESVLMGFCIGLLMGQIQKSIQGHYKITNDKEARIAADEFINSHGGISPTFVYCDPETGNLRLIWNWSQYSDGYHHCKIEMILQPGESPKLLLEGLIRGGDIQERLGCYAVQDLIYNYPQHPINLLLQEKGPLAGALSETNSR